MPIFRAALERLSDAAQLQAQFLPRLAHVHRSGRRTRTEVYAALAAAAEPMLARLDLATGVLGWMDDQGHFRLNTQFRIAEDAELAPSVFNRLMKRMVQAGYAVRRTELIRVKDREHGVSLIRTRCLVMFTRIFWRHLGLSLQYGMARKAAIKRRKRLLAETVLKDNLGKLSKLTKQLKNKAWRKRHQEQQDGPARQPGPSRIPEHLLHQRSAALLEAAQAIPHASAAALRTALPEPDPSWPIERVNYLLRSQQLVQLWRDRPSATVEELLAALPPFPAP